MKTKNILAILIMSLITPLFATAQPQDVLEVKTLTEMTENIEKNSTNLMDVSSPVALARNSIKGLYLNSEWSPAIVYTRKKEFLNCVARFNIYKNRMEIKIGEEFRVLNKNQINGVILEEAPFIAIASKEEADGNVLGYYEVLADGPLSLLKKYRLSLHSTGGTALHPNMGTTQEYKSSYDLYYCLEGQKALKLKKGKKNILKLFGSSSKALKEYSDQEGLGFRKNKDLIVLFDYYNKIQN